MIQLSEIMDKDTEVLLGAFAPKKLQAIKDDIADFNARTEKFKRAVDEKADELAEKFLNEMIAKLQ